MLGLFRGRVYYNLKNWYRSLRMFPGFHYNSRFMESMMGLNEPLELDDEPPPPGLMRRWFVELPALLRLLVRSTWNFWRFAVLWNDSKPTSIAIMTSGRDWISAAKHRMS